MTLTRFKIVSIKIMRTYNKDIIVSLAQFVTFIIKLSNPKDK